MLAVTAALLAFNAPGMAPESMMSRRQAFTSAAAAAIAAAPLAAFADGAASPAVRERARALYGSRVARLVGASPEAVLEEKNMFTLFTTGVYRSDSASKDKRTKLTVLTKTAVAAAKKGDSAGAQAAIKEFIAVGEIKSVDTLELSIYNPKQRRNPGAPTTDTILDQMGSQKFALYEPVAKEYTGGKKK